MSIKKSIFLIKNTNFRQKNRKNLRKLFEENMFPHTILVGMDCIIEFSSEVGDYNDR